MHALTNMARLLSRSVVLPTYKAGMARQQRSPVAARAMASSSDQWHILQYKYVPDILEKRGPHREGHLKAAQHQADAGRIDMAGPFQDPVDGAVFIWKGATPEEIQEWVAADPYVQAGLVPSWTLRHFNRAIVKKA